jgi:hypothetical protein
MCKFQVSRVFDVSSSLEKQLDTMVVFYDFVFPSYSTAPTTTRTISCVYCLSYFRGLFLSDPSLLSILLATERHATEIPNIVPRVQLLGNLPFLFFFVPYRLPGIDFTLSCTRPALSLDLL